MKTVRVLFAALAISLITWACSHEPEVNIAKVEVGGDNSNKVFAYIKSLGFKEKDVIDAGSKYVVEEDIIFPKNMIVPDLKGAKVGQYYTGSLISFTNQADIKVMIDNSMVTGTDMTNEINDAISHWNRYNSPIHVNQGLKVTNVASR